MTQQEVQHLYLRAAFGASPEELAAAVGRSRTEVVGRLFADSARPSPLDAVRQPTGSEIAQALKDKSPEERKKIREYMVGEDKKLNLAFLRRIMSGSEALNEKMTFFWHDHFACRDENPIHAQALNNTLRRYALGDFRQLLLAVSKEPAMLKYLSNQQNRKNAPNENFGREVMELFTLGRGHYSEEDIKNAARAFTGWGFNQLENSYQFREKQHDYGQKTFLGQTGDFNGDDILNIITGRQQCALFITDKVYRYFVNEKGHDERVATLADSFYKSGYDIASLLKAIYTADWFYDAENTGCRIKSPVELMASLARQFGARFEKEQVLLLVQRVLGQLLFDPPNVAGWPNGREWIDSASLIFRASLGKKMIEATAIETAPKPDDDKTPNEMTRREKRFDTLGAEIDWAGFAQQLKNLKGKDLVQKAAGYLLQVPAPEKMLSAADFSAADETQQLKKICALITSLPEYQLC